MTARETFGDEYVDARIRLRQRRSDEDISSPEPHLATDKRNKLLAALTTMGFKKTESKKALAELAKDVPLLPMELLIRRALALLTPG
jgi:Holliday junction resolvasome RuvABC DNA-binding subunit